MPRLILRAKVLPRTDSALKIRQGRGHLRDNHFDILPILLAWLALVGSFQ